ncbi:hypothetical protein BU16DRAFT_447233, partial [Lophium mytilinum]
NRKERRAAAKKAGVPFEPTTHEPTISEKSIEMLMAHPDRSGPKGKSLFDLAAERQAEIRAQNPGKYPDEPSNTPEGETPFDDDPIGPFGNALLYSISLCMLHFTLDVIVYSQYREEVVWREITTRTLTNFPVFMIAVWLLHTRTAMRVPWLRNLFFLGTSVGAGCWLVYSGNMNGYYYVMKTAPPIGTMWVWSVVEMDLGYALASVASVVGYVVWNGFEVF